MRAGVAHRLEVAKLARSGVTRTATLACLVLVALTTVGGAAAAGGAPGTPMGQQAASLIAAPGWAGYVGLAALSVGITALLATGIVLAWTVGREFTDGTIVGLLAIPARPEQVLGAKIGAVLGWAALLSGADALLVAAGGVALGLPLAGAPAAAATVAAVGIALAASALPVAWAATAGRGYLAGIGATLGLVVVSNVGAGFGLGAVIPWAVPVLWATPGSGIGPAPLALPVAVAVVGALAARRAWARLELGAA
ncbi:ABC transporter permease [Brachybacterium sp. YJGR34]|uniref:ABC transporter permease n=1 Tax=Brachybacterium sp. YJGR34 TaxID=2059911 RepID=UPI000E0C15A0|nr:ABC transporter permease [Brachybacterium sp. YJGR34]